MEPMTMLALGWLLGKGGQTSGTPGFPSSGWTQWKKLPPDITTRGAALGQVIQPGAYYVEVTNGRWTLYARTAQGLGVFRLTSAKLADADKAYA